MSLLSQVTKGQSMLTLEQTRILDEMQAGMKACERAVETIGTKPSDWQTGRGEGATIERLEYAREAIGAAKISLQIRQGWM